MSIIYDFLRNEHIFVHHEHLQKERVFVPMQSFFTNEVRFTRYLYALIHLYVLLATCAKENLHFKIQVKLPKMLHLDIIGIGLLFRQIF